MGKPFTLEECLAQAESLMKHYVELHPTDKICYTLAFDKDLVIDPNARKVYLKGRELSLTRKEFDLLFCLASNPGKVFSREQLYDHVWDDTSAFNVSGVVKTHISSLRQKMVGADAEYIKNIWGVGYKFESKPPVEPVVLIRGKKHTPFTSAPFSLPFGLELATCRNIYVEIFL